MIYLFLQNEIENMTDDGEIRKEFGKFFIDIAKLVFGGVVLASIIKIENISKIWIFLLGISATILFAFIGFFILKNKK